MTYYLIYLSVSFFITYLSIYPIKKIAITYNILSETNSISKRQTPYLGGVAIYLGFIITFILFCYMKFPDAEISISLNNPKFLAILIGAIAVTFSGLVHDVYPHSFMIRLAIQIFAGFVIAINSMGIDSQLLQIFPFVIGEHSIYAGNLCATIFWVIMIINSLDSTDKIDGAFSNVLIVLAVIFFAFAIVGNQYDNALILAIVVGCLLGIFIEQARPSKILLGKSGTYFLGFILATLSIDMTYSSNKIIDAVTPIIVFTVPILYFAISLFQKKNIVLYLRDKNINDNKHVFLLTIFSCIFGFLAFILAKVI